MAHGTCTICGAEGRVRRDWCDKHYQRWQAHGDPLWEPKRRDPAQYDSTGHRVHPKVCPSCGTEFLGRTDQVNCSIGCPHRGKRPPGAGLPGAANVNWRGDDVGYHGMHIRVRNARGRADRCEQCGADDPSLNYDWASLVDHPASVDDFAPMCRPCHRKFDFDRDSRRTGWQGRGKKLTADLVRTVRAEHAAGVSLGELVARHGIRREALRRALKGKTWAWIEQPAAGGQT